MINVLPHTTPKSGTKVDSRRISRIFMIPTFAKLKKVIASAGGNHCIATKIFY